MYLDLRAKYYRPLVSWIFHNMKREINLVATQSWGHPGPMIWSTHSTKLAAVQLWSNSNQSFQVCFQVLSCHPGIQGWAQKNAKHCEVTQKSAPNDCHCGIWGLALLRTSLLGGQSLQEIQGCSRTSLSPQTILEQRARANKWSWIPRKWMGNEQIPIKKNSVSFAR